MNRINHREPGMTWLLSKDLEACKQMRRVLHAEAGRNRGYSTVKWLSHVNPMVTPPFGSGPFIGIRFY